MIQYVFAFLLTVLLEFLIISFFIKEKKIKIFLYVALINCFTWPLAMIAYSWGTNFYFIETSVMVIESLLLWGLFGGSFLRALGLSILANLVSGLLSFLF